MDSITPGRKEVRLEKQKNVWKKYKPSPTVQKDADLRHKYGISLDEYNDMLVAQGGKCYICKENSGGQKRPSLRVDHNHKTGKVRKLLCNTCNIIAGLIEHKKYRDVLKYLEEHEEQE